MACITIAAAGCAEQWSAAAQQAQSSGAPGGPSRAASSRSVQKKGTGASQGGSQPSGGASPHSGARFAAVLPSEPAPILPPREETPPPPLGGPPSVDADGQGEEPQQALNWRQRLHLLMEDPESSRLARVISHSVLYTIILSIAGFVLQTLPSMQDFIGWDVIEAGSTVIFTVEYILRFAVCNAFGNQTRLAFVSAPMNVLDVLAILPYYVERTLASLESIHAFRSLRTARLIRIFRVFKLSKYSLGMNLMVEALVNSVRPLSILAFFLTVGVLLFSSLLYYAERMSCPEVKAENWESYQTECLDSGNGRALNGDLCCNEFGSASGFPSIADTFWWSVVTMTTVGYGDMVPRTPLGRAIAGFAMISGITLISLPVAIVGAKFQTAYEEFEQDRDEMLAMEQLEENENEDESGEPEAAPAPSPSSKKLNQAAGQVIQALHVQDKMKKQVEERFGSHRAASEAGTGSQPGTGSEELGRRRVTFGKGSGASRTSLQSRPRTAPIIAAVDELRKNLLCLESHGKLSPAAQEQLQLLLELVDHAERAERQLEGLRAKDLALDACIRRDFIALSRRYDARLLAELSES